MNAILKSLMPTNKPTLDSLGTAWLDAKRKENDARAERLVVEQQLIDLLGTKTEGSQTHTGEIYKVVLTGNLDRKLDKDQLEKIWEQIPAATRDRLIKLKPELDVKELRFTQEHAPDVYALVSRAITTKPAKTSVEVKFVQP